MPKASSSGRKRKLSKYQRAEAIRRRDAGETLATIAKGYSIAISTISRLSSRSTGAWSAAELDQSRHRTEMYRCGDRYRREPGKCNFPAWKATYHDFPKRSAGVERRRAFKRASR
jgi:Helix-turn-helix domain of resolvase